jgi:hypothetical protein
VETIHHIAVKDIAIRDRFRKDPGDLDGLAQDIDRRGLLCPVLLQRNGKKPPFQLIDGERRLRACRDRLGRKTIDARLLDLDDLIDAQIAANTLHKQFTLSERVAIQPGRHDRGVPPRPHPRRLAPGAKRAKPSRQQRTTGGGNGSAQARTNIRDELNKRRRTAMSGEPLEGVMDSAEHEQLYRRLSETAYGHSCQQVFAAALRVACVAAHGMAEGAAEDNPGCRPEALHSASEPLVRKALAIVLAGLELAAKGGEPLPTESHEMGEAQDQEEMVRLLALMVAPVADSPKRLVYHAALRIAADAYTAGAEAADLLRHEERPAEMQRLYGEMLETNRKWRLRKQAEQN